VKLVLSGFSFCAVSQFGFLEVRMNVSSVYQHSIPVEQQVKEKVKMEVGDATL
jgi:hypothetical protein